MTEYVPWTATGSVSHYLSDEDGSETLGLHTSPADIEAGDFCFAHFSGVIEISSRGPEYDPPETLPYPSLEDLSVGLSGWTELGSEQIAQYDSADTWAGDQVLPATVTTVDRVWAKIVTADDISSGVPIVYSQEYLRSEFDGGLIYRGASPVLSFTWVRPARAFTGSVAEGVDEDRRPPDYGIKPSSPGVSNGLIFVTTTSRSFNPDSFDVFGGYGTVANGFTQRYRSLSYDGYPGTFIASTMLLRAANGTEPDMPISLGGGVDENESLGLVEKVGLGSWHAWGIRYAALDTGWRVGEI